jgi:hypothetical protein
VPGLLYPTLILHSDCDGEWSVKACGSLRHELEAIDGACAELPPVTFASAWQESVARSVGLEPSSLRDCFIDVDGEPLIDRLKDLCEIKKQYKSPILFQ